MIHDVAIDGGSSGREERGQAHLPDHELIEIELELLMERLSGVRSTRKVESLTGREGGLAPALSLARNQNQD